MGVYVFLQEYIAWHYSQAIRELWELEKNFLWFGLNNFSIVLLSKTLFAPFYRIRESYKGILSLETLLETLIANVISRMVGFFLRTFVIVIGLTFEAVIAVLFILAFAAWIFLPALIPALFLFGIGLLF